MSGRNPAANCPGVVPAAAARAWISCEIWARSPGTANWLSACPGATDDDPVPTQLAVGLPAADPNALGTATTAPTDSTFECKLDKKPFKACVSPKTVKHLDEHKHTFKVRAIDAAGNVDSSPAKDKFKVVGE